MKNKQKDYQNTKTKSIPGEFLGLEFLIEMYLKPYLDSGELKYEEIKWYYVDDVDVLLVPLEWADEITLEQNPIKRELQGITFEIPGVGTFDVVNNGEKHKRACFEMYPLSDSKFYAGYQKAQYSIQILQQTGEKEVFKLSDIVWLVNRRDKLSQKCKKMLRWMFKEYKEEVTETKPHWNLCTGLKELRGYFDFLGRSVNIGENLAKKTA